MDVNDALKEYQSAATDYNAVRKFEAKEVWVPARDRRREAAFQLHHTIGSCLEAGLVRAYLPTPEGEKALEIRAYSCIDADSFLMYSPARDVEYCHHGVNLLCLDRMEFVPETAIAD